ncbi:MAG: hypothetical protein ABIZ72_01390 [Candidatus Limnocylindrales bacterium]
MDAAHLTQTLTLVVLALATARFALSSAGRAGDGLAGLFVAPDLSLGWPVGVQEIDEPWAWQRPPGSPPSSDPSSHPSGDAALPDAASSEPPRGRYVVAIVRVAPVRLVVKAH